MDPVSEAAAKIKEHSSKCSSLCGQLRAEMPAIEREDVLEKALLHPVGAWTIGGKICGVDGGLAAQSLAGADVIVARAAAACFTYQNGRMRASRQLPHGIPRLEVSIEHSLDGFELSWLKALARLRAELSCALQAVQQFQPDVLLLDGSIVPQVSDKPPKEHGLYGEYETLLRLYESLFETCSSEGVVLAGVIKDSRGKRFLQLLEESIGLSQEQVVLLQKSNDTVFLRGLLRPGERTLAFRYTHAASQHSVLRDFAKHKEAIATMYLRPAPLDGPLRVDFLMPDGSGSDYVDKVASIVQSLCAQNQSYAHPAVLIEADLRAALRPEEVERVVQELAAKSGVGPALFALRRDSRPFR